MARLFICGAETFSLPSAGATDFNAERVRAIIRFLNVELAALQNAGQLDALGYEAGGSHAALIAGPIANQILPPGSVAPTAVTVANAITVFGATHIMHINGGQAPVPAKLAAIQALHAQALAAGVAWRDAQTLDAQMPTLPQAVHKTGHGP